MLNTDTSRKMKNRATYTYNTWTQVNVENKTASYIGIFNFLFTHEENHTLIPHIQACAECRY